jgi:hypothetical protein
MQLMVSGAASFVADCPATVLPLCCCCCVCCCRPFCSLYNSLKLEVVMASTVKSPQPQFVLSDAAGPTAATVCPAKALHKSRSHMLPQHTMCRVGQAS